MLPHVSFNYSDIPSELKPLKQWMPYRLETRDDHQTKIPYSVNSRNQYGSVKNQSDWGTFNEAITICEQFAMDGIGFVFTDNDDFICIDLDNVVDESGNIESWAQDLVDELSTYAERSQSGKGIHIISRGKKPGPRCRAPKVNPQFEMYEHGRFLVFTGNVLPGSPTTVNNSQPAIDKIYSQMFGDTPDNPTPKVSPRNTHTVNVSDSELIERAKSASNGDKFTRLWDGDTSDSCGDHSSADLALCCMLAFWTDNDPGRVDSLFRESGLMRSKWDEYRGTQTYGQMTIEKAVAGCTETYSSPKYPLPGIPFAKDPDAASTTSSATTTNSTSADGNPFIPFLPELTSLSDLGNAEYFIAQYGEKLRYFVEHKKWLIWTGKCWKLDDIFEVDRMASRSIRDMFRLRDNLEPDKYKKLFAHIEKSQAKSRLDAMVALGATREGIAVQAANLDRDQYLINCQNGTFNLKTGVLQPHRQEDNITKIIPAKYYPNANYTGWIQFLNEVFCNDQALIDFMQRLCGYFLTGDTSEESVYILYGRGRCGKSKFVEILTYVLGDYVKDTPLSTFLEHNDTNTADLASLLGARLVTATEAEDNQAFNESLLKRISGRDPVTCRFLFRDYFTYTPTFKVLFATNDIPNFRAQSYAMQARVKIVPFKQRFYEPEENQLPVQDLHIVDKLKREVDGIFRWMVEGALLWQKEGRLPIPNTIRQETANIFGQKDVLAEFLDTQCVIQAGLKTQVTLLWRRYEAWCESEGIPMAFRQTQGFTRNLAQRDGIEPDRFGGGARALAGIGLKTTGFVQSSAKCDELYAQSDVLLPFPESSLMENNLLEKVQENAKNSSPRHTCINTQEEDEIIRTLTGSMDHVDTCESTDSNPDTDAPQPFGEAEFDAWLNEDTTTSG